MKRDERKETLNLLLTRERQDLRDRVKVLRQDQDQEALTTPGDVMDVAKALLDVETHASLISRIEDQLLQLDTALSRLEEGKYGLCMACGNEIPVERLEALPSTVYCVDCQSALRDDAPESTAVERQSYKTWTPPPEADENEVLSDGDLHSTDELSARESLSDDQNNDMDSLVPEEPVKARS
jgi:DnaK suppressor protein